MYDQGVKYDSLKSIEGELWPSCGSDHAEGAGLLVALGHCSSHCSSFSCQVLGGNGSYGGEMQAFMISMSSKEIVMSIP